jgi:hypothetical protein
VEIFWREPLVEARWSRVQELRIGKGRGGIVEPEVNWMFFTMNKVIDQADRTDARLMTGEPWRQFLSEIGALADYLEKEAVPAAGASF